MSLISSCSVLITKHKIVDMPSTAKGLKPVRQ